VEKRSRRRKEVELNNLAVSGSSNMTRLEVHGDEKLILRITVADKALAKIGNELGMLIAKIVPGPRILDADPEPADIVISAQHADDDETYHSALREHLVDLFGALCDTALTDALDIARREQTWRMAESN
jgi:hypothetical protein